MADIEIEIWSESDRDDYARVLREIPDDRAKELYRHLRDSAITWCEEEGLDPEEFQRRTGRDVIVADVLQWYVEEGLLEQEEDDGEVVFYPSSSVANALSRQELTIEYRELSE